MKCEACEKNFPDQDAKVWKGKRVCADCFEVLSDQDHSREVSSKDSTEEEDLKYKNAYDAISTEISPQMQDWARRSVESHENDPQMLGLVFEKDRRDNLAFIFASVKQLQVTIDNNQIQNIYRNLWGDRNTPVVLTPVERTVATEALFLSWMKLLGPDGAGDFGPDTPAEKIADFRQTMARKVAARERTVPGWQKAGRAVVRESGCGCLLLFCTIGFVGFFSSMLVFFLVA